MDNKNYYENFDWDKANLKNHLNKKIELVKSSIPSDVKTVLDLGCGDGTISNGLKDSFNIVAIDRSFNALKYLQTDSVQASADCLPIKDSSIDLLFSSEMIEHLPQDIYENALKEMKRISYKYVFLTFPDNENIDKNIVECIKCKTTFNKSYHLRSLNLEMIKKEFPNHKVIKVFHYGTKIRYYNKALSKMKHLITPSEAWIPKAWTKNGTRKTMCPDCGHHFEIPQKFNLFAFLIDSLNTIISVKKPYQICVLLEKNHVR